MKSYKPLNPKTQQFQQSKDYGGFAFNTELKIEKFKIEGNDLLNELKNVVNKTEDILYSLADKLKYGVDTLNQIKNTDDKLLANDMLN